MRLAIDSREAVLQKFIDRCAAADVPEEVAAQLQVFGVVQICGYIERSMKIIILERLKKKAHPRVIEFIKSYFKYGTNFRCGPIKDFLDRFDTDWGRSFERFVSANDDVKEAVAAAYELRNRAAHGNAVQLGQKRLQEFFEQAKKLIDAVCKATV